MRLFGHRADLAKRAIVPIVIGKDGGKPESIMTTEL